MSVFGLYREAIYIRANSSMGSVTSRIFWTCDAGNAVTVFCALEYCNPRPSPKSRDIAKKDQTKFIGRGKNYSRTRRLLSTPTQTYSTAQNLTYHRHKRHRHRVHIRYKILPFPPNLYSQTTGFANVTSRLTQ